MIDPAAPSGTGDTGTGGGGSGGSESDNETIVDAIDPDNANETTGIVTETCGDSSCLAGETWFSDMHLIHIHGGATYRYSLTVQCNYHIVNGNKTSETEKFYISKRLTADQVENGKVSSDV